jgi:hypothetical protein
MTAIASVGLYRGLGWRWLNRRGTGTVHLFPAQPGPLSRSACGRLKADPALLEEPLLGLFADAAARCRDCEGRAGL